MVGGCSFRFKTKLETVDIRDQFKSLKSNIDNLDTNKIVQTFTDTLRQAMPFVQKKNGKNKKRRCKTKKWYDLEMSISYSDNSFL